MTKRESHDQTSSAYTLLLPIFALSSIIILISMIVNAYATTNALPNKIILPGGVTYLGK